MSFGDLQKLKERLGTKVYNETLFGKKMKKKKEDFKRENKNRPREMSAKIPVSKLNQIARIKKAVSRDPRFDSLCGTFDEKAFKKSYSFISELREKDLDALRIELRSTEDPRTVRKIKYLIQRLENQLREEKRLKEKQQKKQRDKKELLESIKRGEKPVFKKKCKDLLLTLSSLYLVPLYIISIYLLQRRRRYWI